MPRFIIINIKSPAIGYPQLLLLVYEKIIDFGAGQGGGIVRNILKGFKGLAIVAIEAIRSTNPYKTFGILNDPFNGILREPVFCGKEVGNVFLAP